jgi:hypothetical protein
MSTLPKIIPCALLTTLALYVPPTYGGSADILPASPAPVAATPVPTGNLPWVPGPSSSSGEQMVLRLNRLLANDFGGPVPVLVIPAQEMAPETYDRIVDDLNIMNRIIEKNTGTLGDGGRAYGALLGGPGDIMTPRMLRPLGGRPKPMYIGGYGAVFSLAVDFPLLPPEGPEPNQVTEKADPTWIEAQRELLDPQAVLRVGRATVHGRAYRADAVENLRSTLIGLLKHATNIRDLAPDAWLTILVQGGSATWSVYGEARYGPDQMLMLPAARGAGRTLLTLRARKTDIDQYATGALDAKQFRQRVQIVTR